MNNPTRIVLIRHGQTVWNKGDRFRGQIDLALDDTGELQARAIARRVGSLPITHMYCSPLKRAAHTARPLAELRRIHVHPLPAFNDIDYGEWQGLSPAEVAAKQPDLYRQWRTRPDTVTFPGGESLEVVRARAVAQLRDLVDACSGETIAIVSHKVVCKLFILHVLGLDSSHFWCVEQDNGAINILESQNGVLSAALVNDTCHLNSLKTAKTIS